jgi:hypothetical protein
MVSPSANLTVKSRQGASMSAFEPVTIPDWAWRSAPAQTALRKRDASGILRVAQQYGGASQHRLSNLVGIQQGRISEILKGTRQVTAFDVFERIADGLRMPDHARAALGLAPSQEGGTGEALAGLGEIVRIFPDQAAATADIRHMAAAANHIDVLAVRGLGVLALKDSLLRGSLMTTEHRAALRVLLARPDAEATAKRAVEIGESPESFASGIRHSISRVRELADVVDLEIYLYDRLPVWRLVGLDDTLYAATFADRWEGHESPTYKLVSTPGGALYSGFRRTFEDLRQRAERVV